MARRRRAGPGRRQREAQARRDLVRRPEVVRLASGDAEYRRSDNAKVALKIALPGGGELTLDAEPDGREAGTYSATYVPKQAGAYRAVATATAPDGSLVGERDAGWAAQPLADEFSRLEPDRAYLKTLADRTNGEVVDGDRLDAFVTSLASKDVPITEPWTAPLWHQPLYFLIAIASLATEWAIRRVNGLARLGICCPFLGRRGLVSFSSSPWMASLVAPLALWGGMFMLASPLSGRSRASPAGTRMPGRRRGLGWVYLGSSSGHRRLDDPLAAHHGGL